jgi:hypothetical protein
MSRRQRRMHEKRRRHPRERRIPGGRQIATGAGVTVGATLLMGGAAQAACTCTVDSLADPTAAGHTTLRDAIDSAETSANSGSTITFASGLSGTITLASTLPPITYPTTIEGPGAGALAVSGDDANRILYIDAIPTSFPVTISGLTLTHGYVQGSEDERNGGAITNFNADLTITSSVLSGNQALGDAPQDGYGGAICTCSDVGTLTVRDSALTGNTAGGSGGAIYSDSTPVTLERTTLNGNQAYFRGGAVSLCCITAGPSTIENSTLAGNTVNGTDGSGGGLYSQSGGGITFTGSTVAGNSAPNGGGLFQQASTAVPIVLRNSIVANNTGTTGPDLDGPFESAFTLIRDTADATITETVAGSDITGQNPQLGALASNGGPTKTLKPAITSPVINKGSAFGLTVDERGRLRPFEMPNIPNSTAVGADGSDMGAFEFQTSDVPPPSSTPTPTPTPTPSSPAAPHKKKCKKKKHKRSAQSAKKKCKKKKKR